MRPFDRSRKERAHATSSAIILPDDSTTMRSAIGLQVWQEVNALEKLEKWEYATVPLISHALQEILNQWGEEGWELVQVIESQALGMTAYLKRPKPGEPPPTE